MLEVPIKIGAQEPITKKREVSYLASATTEGKIIASPSRKLY